MKTRAVILLITLLATVANVDAASVPTVESKGAFIKIVASAPLVDTPAELNPPLLLYIRKSAILSVSMTFAARSVNYDVAIATLGPDIEIRSSGATVSTADASKANSYRLSNEGSAASVKVYLYRFAKEANAMSFCDAVISNQDG
jgi:hypothetical protein